MRNIQFWQEQSSLIQFPFFDQSNNLMDIGENILVAKSPVFTAESQKQCQELKPEIKKETNPLEEGAGGTKKNVCRFLTKKILNSFIRGDCYKKRIAHMCHEQGITVRECQTFYENKSEKHKYIGPKNISLLFEAQAKDVAKVRVFRKFFVWFLKERAVRHILLEGRMTNKADYLSYKNMELFQLIAEK